MTDFFKDVFDWIAKWFLDLFLWAFELVYELVNEFFAFFLDAGVSLLLSVLSIAKGYIPSGLIGYIVASFEWLKYIGDWIPVQFMITLLISYLAIKIALIPYRFLRRLIFGGGG